MEGFGHVRDDLGMRCGEIVAFIWMLAQIGGPVLDVGGEEPPFDSPDPLPFIVSQMLSQSRGLPCSHWLTSRIRGSTMNPIRIGAATAPDARRRSGDDE